ncbi:leucine zipper transcription factor-like protein 1 [Sycon ciliatum]|uniref:leucine zipper transcription factor-like protein 1 n=1 Tax=Sycon ciliatum TaxID=27933 RepID=UPI0020ACAFB0|eukprot:scpid70271/ scgid7091/ Leucine zipper transcription factor-like protein 1
MAQATGNPFGLTANHEKIVSDFFAFARLKRTERLLGVDGTVDDVRDSSVSEDGTYSGTEMLALLDGLKDTLHSSVESELIDSDYTQVLLLCQLFRKAQEWKLTLEADITTLEDRQLLEDVAKFERGELPNSRLQKKLDPIEDPGAFMRMEIDRLKEENKLLHRQLDAKSEEATSASKEKQSLATTLDSTKQALDKATEEKQSASANKDDVQSQLDQTKAQLDKLKESKPAAAAASGDTEEKLAASLREILSLQDELKTAKEDVSKKFNETSAYKNMMKMMGSKNEQLREMRTKLANYEEEGK